MKKLIIIPAYNESACIRDTVADIMEKVPDFDYIVINDCSKDQTGAILEENHFHYIDLPVNLGIGGAVQTGYRYALENGYDIAVQVDGDGQHDASFLPQMVETLCREQADMVIGSRFITNEGFQSSAARRLGISYFSKLIRGLTGVTVTDPTSGFRMVNRDVIEMFADKYPRDYPEPESIVHIITHKKKVVEVPVIMRERQGGVSSIHFSRSIYYMIKVTLAMLIEKLR